MLFGVLLPGNAGMTTCSFDEGGRSVGEVDEYTAFLDMDRARLG